MKKISVYLFSILILLASCYPPGGDLPEDTYYKLTLAVAPESAGEILYTPVQATYLSGTTVHLTAAPAPGYMFKEWQGAITGNSSPATVIMDGQKTITAVFEHYTSAYLTSLVSKSGYITDLEYASRVRPPDSANWLDVQTYCKNRLATLGYNTELQAYDSGVNVVGIRTGSLSNAGNVIISAHYDSMPGSVGADDNGTGIAGALAAAAALSATDYKNTLIVAFWDEEETGFHGSLDFTAKASANSDNILIAIVLEMIGYYSEEDNSQTFPAGFSAAFPDQIQAITGNNNRGDFILCTYDEDAADWYTSFSACAFNINLSSIAFPLTNAQTQSTDYSELMRSDHAPFWYYNYPSVMITDTANYRNPNYHTMNDITATLNHDFAVRVIKAVVASAADMLIITG